MELEASKRETFGKNEANRLRSSGKIPGVLYGGSGDRGTPVSVEPKALLRILHSPSGTNTLIDLRLGGESTRVLVKEYQLDPITHHLLHADFYRVAMDKPITVTVPIVLRGEARGVKQQGGIVDFVHRDVEIECLPGDIPDQLEADVSELMLHQGIRLRDLMTDVKWTPVSDPDMLIVHVITPKAEEVPAAPEAVVAAPAEPEVIKKGKVEKPEEEE
jgi:large subunit ribosomal protein L25